MSAGLPEGMAAYLQARDQQRSARVAKMYESLTERERLLVKEAAVMGWVQGVRHHDAKIPSDRDVVATVLDAASAFDDLYPTLANLGSP